MALNKNTLAAAIKTTFETAADQAWTAQQVADGLATAIDAFVRSAEVAGVKSKLALDVPNNTGTGTQTGTVHLQ